MKQAKQKDVAEKELKELRGEKQEGQSEENGGRFEKDMIDVGEKGRKERKKR